MSFLNLRNKYMELGMNRRVATLAARIALGVETFEDIARTPGFTGRPLLWPEEASAIKQVHFLEGR